MKRPTISRSEVPTAFGVYHRTLNPGVYFPVVRAAARGLRSSSRLMQHFILEVDMKSTLQRLAVLAALLGYVGVAGFGSSMALAAEVVYTKTARQVLSELKSIPAGETLGELAQGVFQDTIGNPNAVFPVAETQVFNHDMTMAGNGNHRGYEILIFKSGERAFSTYEGTHKVVTKSDGDWEVIYQGTQAISGGTGKYKDLKAKGTYTGRITAVSFHEENKWNLR